ncbi:hypothetical protein FFK22_014475 [Mycobacterium sp. KBS0706]|uniref:hypothetical protein n=1 Tax=Mycobacterium sp. KBS0706 TaxID=2578109 RepID=UPI00110FB620|nr:hypothetical protein [Mycobacterium sp. KBS0706]TSD88038.1 hypothetical protein FFK22_014475 [Mycobacterium sp. KBS0706]
MTDITGRDHHIIVRALAYAITIIDSLPPEAQEASDCDDMRTLLAALCPNARDRQWEVYNARNHLSHGGKIDGFDWAAARAVQIDGTHGVQPHQRLTLLDDLIRFARGQDIPAEEIPDMIPAFCRPGLWVELVRDAGSEPALKAMIRDRLQDSA